MSDLPSFVREGTFGAVGCYAKVAVCDAPADMVGSRRKEAGSAFGVLRSRR